MKKRYLWERVSLCNTFRENFFQHNPQTPPGGPFDSENVEKCQKKCPKMSKNQIAFRQDVRLG